MPPPRLPPKSPYKFRGCSPFGSKIEGLHPMVELIQGMSSLLESSEYYDFVIECRQYTFCVHRSIICPRSSFFAALFKNVFAEASSRRVDLKDDDPEAVRNMVLYFYRLSYDDGYESPEQRPVSAASKLTTVLPTSLAVRGPTRLTTDDPVYSPGMINTLVYAIAEKYGIEGLKNLAKAKFKACMKDDWNNAEFSLIVQAIYESTPERDLGLRAEAVRLSVSHYSVLKDREEFQILQRRVPAFTLDVLNDMALLVRPDLLGCQSTSSPAIDPNLTIRA